MVLCNPIHISLSKGILSNHCVNPDGDEFISCLTWLANSVLFRAYCVKALFYGLYSTAICVCLFCLHLRLNIAPKQIANVNGLEKRVEKIGDKGILLKLYCVEGKWVADPLTLVYVYMCVCEIDR